MAKNVLIVEDDKNIAELLRLYLEKVRKYGLIYGADIILEIALYHFW